MYRIIRFLLGLLGSLGAIQALAQIPTTVPVTGNLAQILGSPQPYSGVVFSLQNCLSPVTITGYNVIVQTTMTAQANSAGLVNTNIWPNDKINCGGTTGSSQYLISYVVGGLVSGTPQCYQAISTAGTFSLNTAQPQTCSTNPTGGSNPPDGTFTNLVVNQNLQAGSITAPSFIPSRGSITVDVRSYGAICNGLDINSAADTSGITAAVAFVNTQPANNIDLHFPPGVCVINAASVAPAANITANNVTVEGPGATLKVLTASVPLNTFYNVPTGSTTYWWFLQIQGNNSTVKGLTFDSNGQATTNCGGAHGCLWIDGITGTPAPANLKVLDNTFLVGGWSVLSAGANTNIRGNYATGSGGMVCENGANGCVIDSNISVNAIDASFAVNGGTTTNLYVSNFAITNNLAIGTSLTTPNGNGIDVTAAQDGVVANNTVTGQSNACILVDMSGGMYSEGAAGTYIPSQRVKVTGNHCKGNNTYGGWPINGEIVVGNIYANNGGTPFTAGQTATNVTVEDNDVTAYNPAANDYGVVVAYGASNVKIQGQYFTGCGTVASGTCASVPFRIFDTSGTSNLKYIANHQDAAYAGVIRTQGPGPYEVWGNGASWQVASGNPTQAPNIVEGTLQVGDNNASNFFAGVINLLGGTFGVNGLSGKLAFLDGAGLVQATMQGSTVSQNLTFTLQPNWSLSVNTYFNAQTGYKLGGLAPLGHCLVGDGTAYVDSASCGGGGGGGTVNSGTASQFTYYAETGTTVSGNAHLTDNGTQIGSTLPVSVADASGIGGSLAGQFGTAPTPSGTSSTLWADSTASRWMINNANTGGQMVPGVATAAGSGDCVKYAANGIDLADTGTPCANTMTSTPTTVANSGAGTSPTVSLISGATDGSGFISILEGTAPAVSAGLVTINYGGTYATIPKCVIAPAGANSAALSGTTQVYVSQSSSTTAQFVIRVGSVALTAGTTYVWGYSCSL